MGDEKFPAAHVVLASALVRVFSSGVTACDLPIDIKRRAAIEELSKHLEVDEVYADRLFQAVNNAQPCEVERQAVEAASARKLLHFAVPNVHACFKCGMPPVVRDAPPRDARFFYPLLEAGAQGDWGSMHCMHAWLPPPRRPHKLPHSPPTLSPCTPRDAVRQVLRVVRSGVQH